MHSIPAPNADASVQVEVADEADDGASISSLRLSAKSLFGRFFEAPEVEAQLHLHSRFGESIQAAIASWGDAGDDLVDEEDAVRPLFDEASRHVHGVLATEYFPRFLESDHYIAMMTRRLDEHLGTADPAEEDDAVLTLPAGGLDPVDSPEPSAFDPAHGRRPSHRGWVNDRGFKSVHVDVLAARNLRDGFMGSNPDAYCCVWLDTTCFRNSVVSGSNPNWDEATDDSHFEFPLRPTSLHASIEVFDHQLMRHDKHLGSISIQVVDVFQQYYALQNGVADALAGGDDAPDPEDGVISIGSRRLPPSVASRCGSCSGEAERPFLSSATCRFRCTMSGLAVSLPGFDSSGELGNSAPGEPADNSVMLFEELGDLDRLVAPAEPLRCRRAASRCRREAATEVDDCTVLGLAALLGRCARDDGEATCVRELTLGASARWGAFGDGTSAKSSSSPSRLTSGEWIESIEVPNPGLSIPAPRLSVASSCTLSTAGRFCTKRFGPPSVTPDDSIESSSLPPPTSRSTGSSTFSLSTSLPPP